MSASRSSLLAVIKTLSTPNTDPDARWPQSYDDWRARFNTNEPYPLYSPPEPSTPGDPLPNGGPRSSSSPLPPSSEPATASSFRQPNGSFHDVAQRQRDVSDEWQPMAYRQPVKTRTQKQEHEVATSPSGPYIANRRKRAIRDQQPEQHEASVSMQDAREQARVRMTRTRTARKRVSKTLSKVQKLENRLVVDKTTQERAVDHAVALETAAARALDALNRARAESSAIQKQSEGYSRPRRLFNYLMARWETEPRPEVEEAACRADEAARVHSLTRIEADTAWDTMHRCAREVGLTTSLLREAQQYFANAKRVHLSLQTAADLAADRAPRTPEAVGVSLSRAESVCEAYGRGGRMHHPLPALSRIAESSEDGSTSDQVVNNTKRVRH